MALTDKLTAIANAIREKTGKTDKMSMDEMAAAVLAIDDGKFSGIEKTFTPTEVTATLELDVPKGASIVYIVASNNSTSNTINKILRVTVDLDSKVVSCIIAQIQYGTKQLDERAVFDDGKLVCNKGKFDMIQYTIKFF